MPSLTRRGFALAGLAIPAGLVGGCAILPEGLFEGWSREAAGPIETPDYATIYAAVPGEKHRVPAFDFTNMDPVFLRAEIAYAGMEPPGTIVVDRKRHHLYHVQGGGRARRYGIAVGPEATVFSGRAVIGSRLVWPDWSPARLAAARSLSDWAQLGTPARAQEPAGAGGKPPAGGDRPPATGAKPSPGTIPGGPRSPLGARALFLAADGRDTGFVIHGTPDPIAIGGEIKQGCIALIDQDIIHLYERAPEGTPAVVLM